MIPTRHRVIVHSAQGSPGVRNVDLPFNPGDRARASDFLHDVRVQWSDIFGNDHPVEVEIGPERGTFLLATAAAHPERNYFGIERSRSRAERLATALRKGGLGNVRALCADATCVLTQCVPAGSVSAYHTYFPDPWWKRRHYRRRLLTPEFAAVLECTLAVGGVIHLVSDVEETFRLGCLSLGTVPNLLQTADACDRPVRTAFEQKALRRGSRLYAASFRKLASMPESEG